MPIPQETISKYVKFLRLAHDRTGNPNEQVVAHQMMKRLRDEHPGIHEAAVAEIAAAEDVVQRPPPPPPEHDAEPPPRPRPEPRQSTHAPRYAPHAPIWATALLNSVLNRVGMPVREQLLALLTPEWQDLGHLASKVHELTPDSSSPATAYGLLLHQAYSLVKSGQVELRPTDHGLQVRRTP